MKKLFLSLTALAAIAVGCQPRVSDIGCDEEPTTFADFHGTYLFSHVAMTYADSNGYEEEDSWYQDITILQDGPSVALEGVLMRADDVGIASSYEYTYNDWYYSQVVVKFEAESEAETPNEINLSYEVDAVNSDYSYDMTYVVTLSSNLLLVP